MELLELVIEVIAFVIFTLVVANYFKSKLPKELVMKSWNVYKPNGITVGQVQEETEELARCAALSIFGTTEEEAQKMSKFQQSFWILPDEEFSVRQV